VSAVHAPGSCLARSRCELRVCVPHEDAVSITKSAGPQCAYRFERSECAVPEALPAIHEARLLSVVA
jgi:hypothetical protein